MRIRTETRFVQVAGVYPLPPAIGNPAAVVTQPCNSLTKQYLDDGSVLFNDICTKEAKMATPAELKAQKAAAVQ